MADGPVGVVGQWSGARGLRLMSTLPLDLVLQPNKGPSAIFRALLEP